MKRNIVFFALIVTMIAFPQCNKETKGCSPKSVASEASAIQTYATANSINAVAHQSGLYYEILDPGTGATPSANSKIYITYTGKLLDGTTFDSQSNAAGTGWSLNGLIEGWRVGIPLIKKGGHIKLLVPSSMAYGCNPYNGLPGNSILYFDIVLVDVQ